MHVLHVGAWALQLYADVPDSNFAALSISIHCCVVQAIMTPCISCVQSEFSSELLLDILYNGVRVQLPGCSSTEGASCTLQAFEVNALFGDLHSLAMYVDVFLNLCVSALLCEVFPRTLLRRATATLEHIIASICSNGKVAIQSNALQCIPEDHSLSLLVARAALGHAVSHFWHHPQLRAPHADMPNCLQHFW